MEIDVYTWVFLAYLMGAVLRTVYAFLWKILDEPDLPFDKKFLVTMIISIIITFIVAATTFMGVVGEIPDTPINRTLLFFTFLSLGYTLNDIINRPVSYLSTKVAESKT